MAALEKCQILIDGIRGAPIPIAVLRRHGGSENEQSPLLAPEVPPFGGAEMLVEASGIVLGEHRHLLNVGVGHIAQSKIDAPVAACDRHGAHRPPPGQLLHPSVIASR